MAPFLNKKGFLSGASPQNRRPQGEGQDIILSPKLYAGQWVLSSNGNMFYSDGENWIPSLTEGVEILVPPWGDVPVGWFEVNSDLGTAFGNRKLISNKFTLNYTAQDTTSWLIIEKANLYTDPARTNQVQSPPEPVGGVIDISGKDNHGLQDIPSSRPTWRTRVRNSVTFDQIYTTAFEEAIRVPVPTNPFEGSAILSYGTGSKFNPEEVAATIHVSMYSEDGFVTIAPQRWPIEEIVLFDRALTATEAAEFISKIENERGRPDQNGFTGMVSAKGLFDRMLHLSTAPPMDFSQTTNLEVAFRDTNITTISSSYDFSNVENAEAAFLRASLTSFPDYDWSALVNGRRMLENTMISGLPQLVKFPALDNAEMMFKNCPNLASFPDEVANPTKFPVCTNFTETWRDCPSLTDFPAIDLSSGITFKKTWEDCTGLTDFGVGLDGDDNTIQVDISNGQDFTEAWRNCPNLTGFPNLDFSSATKLAAAWRDCTGLTSFPTINTSNVTDFGEDTDNGAWQGCTGLTSFPVIDLTSADKLTSAWDGCTGLTSFPSLDTSGATSIRQTWRGCSGLGSFPNINFGNVSDVATAWEGCSGLTAFPATDFPLGKNFSFTWKDCTSLTSFPLVDTSSGKRFQSAWEQSGLTSFPALNFSSVSDTTPGSGDSLHRSWYQCSDLADFPANVFDNTQTRNYAEAFTGCALTQTSVDNILVSVQSMLSTYNGGGSLNNGRLDIDGGTNATPSTTGKAAADDLRNNHNWTVNLNGY